MGKLEFLQGYELLIILISRSIEKVGKEGVELGKKGAEKVVLLS